MYNQYLKITSSKFGLGVFTTVNIPSQVPIIEMTGDLFDKKNAPHDHPALLQIGVDSYLGPSGDASDYVNHHCNPNCYLHIVGSRAILYSLFEIKSGEELFFDYSTTSTDSLEEWQMQCGCGAYNCRKIISGFQYLSQELQDRYINMEIVPLFMTNKIMRFNK